MTPQVTLKFDEGVSKVQISQALQNMADLVGLPAFDLRRDADLPLWTNDTVRVGTLFVRGNE